MVKKKMRAAVFEGNGVLNIKEVDTAQMETRRLDRGS